MRQHAWGLASGVLVACRQSPAVLVNAQTDALLAKGFRYQPLASLEMLEISTSHQQLTRMGIGSGMPLNSTAGNCATGHP